MIARSLFEMCVADPENTEFPEWCSAGLDESKNSDRAYPLLIVNNFPSGLKVGGRWVPIPVTSFLIRLSFGTGSDDCFLSRCNDVIHLIRLQFSSYCIYVRHLPTNLRTIRSQKHLCL